MLERIDFMVEGRKGDGDLVLWSCGAWGGKGGWVDRSSRRCSRFALPDELYVVATGVGEMDCDIRVLQIHKGKK